MGISFSSQMIPLRKKTAVSTGMLSDFASTALA
jgi:hypothetical protein